MSPELNYVSSLLSFYRNSIVAVAKFGKFSDITQRQAIKIELLEELVEAFTSMEDDIPRQQFYEMLITDCQQKASR
jgi:hypothetical protein